VVFYADLHVHSKHSRACSRNADLENLAWWGARKGLGVVGTGDVTHPQWSASLAADLVPDTDGLYRLRPELELSVLRRLPPSCRTPVRFAVCTEVSTIYSAGGRTRKVHHLLNAPSLDAAARITDALSRIGNLGSDGRPILGLDSRDLLDITASAGGWLVPAHIWTPWFAVLGSRSGFDDVADCYRDLAGEIFAVETGLSSDIAMNRRVSSLDRYRLVSNSDAHSPPALAREATLFAGEPGHRVIERALRTGAGLLGTVGMFPEEGRYHADGHRACGVRLRPAETRALDGRCPVCGKALTIGVLHRVEELADRAEGAVAGAAVVDGPTARSLVALPAVVSELLGVGAGAKRVIGAVNALVASLGPELRVLTEVPLDEVAAVAVAALGPGRGPALPEALRRLRAGEVTREPGFDGQYGTVRLFEAKELAEWETVPALFDLPAASRPTAEAATVAGSGPPGEPVPLGEPATLGEPPPTGGAVPTISQVALEGVPTGSVLAGLDPDQRAAAEVPGGPLLVIAGPGTGKTRTLTYLVAHRVRELGVPPERSLVVTFTRRAAAELRDRLTALIGDRAERVMVTTFHGLGLRILREQHHLLGVSRRLGVADETVRRSLLAQLLAEQGDPDNQAEVRTVAARLAALRRDQALGPVQLDPVLARLRGRYDAALRERDMVDLDDLLSLPVRLLAADPDLVAEYRACWPWIHVDEYQDVDPVQYRLLSLLSPPGGNLCAIGDPDQAIYSFRGADVEIFLRFTADRPTARTVPLTRNYRTPATVLRAAVQEIAPGTLVPDRRLDAVGPARACDAPVRVLTAADDADEAREVVARIEQLLGGTSFAGVDAGRVDPNVTARLSFADIAVLYRTEAQAAALLTALDERGLPVQHRSHRRISEQPGVDALLTLLSATPANPPRSVLARLRTAGAELGMTDEVRTALELLTTVAETAGADESGFRTELALGAEVDTWDPRADRISLLTLHAAKGLEFPAVVIVGVEEGLLPLRFGGAEPDRATIAEERRLLFVGMTRTAGSLTLTGARRRAGRERRPSRFLDAIEPALLDRSPARPARAAQKATQLRLL
jgi:superfamily I DNA/RNA helicase/PHP family Zn ribbon phosphoesterase